jgi:ribosome-associated heat shock protein Hsp15
MDSTEKVRIDKWLWAVRLFKTRSLAAEACDKGRIRIGDLTVKPSRSVKIGEEIVLHRGPWYQHIKVLDITEKRMGAALVKDFLLDVTPSDELEKNRLHQLAQAAWNIKGGTGRPTKKDRREIDDFTSDW